MSTDADRKNFICDTINRAFSPNVRIEGLLGGSSSVVIAGHIRPDGDSIGSCLALRNYIKALKKDIPVSVFVQPPFDKKMLVLSGSESIITDASGILAPDIFFALDCSDAERLGDASALFESAARTVCIDHHVTGIASGFADCNIIYPKMSSTAEVLFYHMDYAKIDRAAAECLYLGIAFDTGVFRHTNVSLNTMIAAGALLEFGLDNETLITNTFFTKTFKQKKALAFALERACLKLGGRVILSGISLDEMNALDINSADLEGISDAMRTTDGVLASVFISERGNGLHKISMRANGAMDVERVAAAFGGGGHIKAAGCNMEGGRADVVSRILEEIKRQL